MKRQILIQSFWGENGGRAQCSAFLISSRIMPALSLQSHRRPQSDPAERPANARRHGRRCRGWGWGCRGDALANRAAQEVPRGYAPRRFSAQTPRRRFFPLKAGSCDPGVTATSRGADLNSEETARPKTKAKQ